MADPHVDSGRVHNRTGDSVHGVTLALMLGRSGQMTEASRGRDAMRPRVSAPADVGGV